MKANFIIIKMLAHIGLIVEIATGYTIENIKEFGEKERKHYNISLFRTRISFKQERRYE